MDDQHVLSLLGALISREDLRSLRPFCVSQLFAAKNRDTNPGLETQHKSRVEMATN